MLDLSARCDTFSVSARIDPTQNPSKVVIDSHDTIINLASCTWLGIQSNDRDLQSGSVNAFSAPWEGQSGPFRWTKEVVFPKSYAAEPSVVIWLSDFDVDSRFNCRLNTHATDITATGFIITIDTWWDTILRSATVSWIAHPSDRANIASGGYGTGDVRPSEHPQLSNQGRVSFGKTFQRPPRVWAALSSLDIACWADLRIKSTTSDIGTDGMAWSIDSWNNSILYSAAVKYIAIQEF